MGILLFGRDEHGIFRHEFQLPAQWKGKPVNIVFEGVMTDAEVKVNGKPAGPLHQGAFFRNVPKQYPVKGSFYWLFFPVVQKSFTDNRRIGYIFAIFALFTFFSFFFFKKYIVETKGKTLEELEKETLT